MGYFYTDANRKPQGPVPREKLIELFTAGEITSASLVVEEGNREWKPLASLLESKDVPAMSPEVMPPVPPVVRTTEPLAIWSLVLSLVGSMCCAVGGSIAAIVCGHMALLFLLAYIGLICVGFVAGFSEAMSKH